MVQLVLGFKAGVASPYLLEACHGCCGPRNTNADLGCAGAVLG